MAKRKAAARRRPAAKRTRASASKSARRKTAAKKGGAKKRVARKMVRRAAASKKTAARGRAKPKARASVRKVARKSVKKTARRAAPPKVARSKTAAQPKRKLIPGLDRERRAVTETDEFVLTPPSSLNLDRTASSARSGRRELQERYDKHTETSPALTAGDIDADWESAYSVGDEAPGGDNPTPDQDIVDDIGRAVGVEYQDNEELKGEKKLLERDKHRWELDPASAEDYEDR